MKCVRQIIEFLTIDTRVLNDLSVKMKEFHTF